MKYDLSNPTYEVVAMKERMTISIDKEIYDFLQELPRKVSISEVLTFLVKAAFKEIKDGRELTDTEFQQWMDSTPEGKDFRERLIENWGLAIKKIGSSV
jgi:predicted CopG family antitoxin